MSSTAARSALAVAGLLVSAAAAAQTAIDGDTLVLDGKTYRLNGIDAPDPEQVCPDGWPAGYEAGRYLQKLVEGRKVVCVTLVGDDEGEVFAQCRADGVDLSSAMTTAGHAFAFVPQSAQYIAEESAAVSAKRGVHAHHCAPPWEWRLQFDEAR